MVPKLFGRKEGVGARTALQGREDEREAAAAVQGSVEGPVSIRKTDSLEYFDIFGRDFYTSIIYTP